MAEIIPKGADSYPGGKGAYVDAIIDLVKVIMANPVGYVILTAIIRTPKQLTILPESERPRGSFDPNRTYAGSTAATFPVDPAGTKPDYAGASPPGLSREGADRKRWYTGRDDDEDTETDPATHRGDERYDAAPASWGEVRGGGSHTRIYFTPGGGSDAGCARGYGTCAAMADEVLLHEMVHALRMMQGVSNPVPTTLRYKNEEEFLAIVVTNVYISKKKGNRLLRPDYKGVGPLPPPWNTSDGFLGDAENRRILEYYAGAWQPVFGRLGEVQTAFNPFRALRSPRKP